MVEKNNLNIPNPAQAGNKSKSVVFLHVYGVIVLIVVIAAALLYLFSNVNNDSKYVESVVDAGIKFDEGDVDGAISGLEKYLQSDLSDGVRAAALISLASSYAQKGSLEFKESEYGKKAIDSITLSLKLLPDVSEAYRVMAYAYEIMQDYDNAIPNYAKAISLDWNNAMAYSGLGHTYDLLGDLDKAKANYEQSLSINPDLDHSLYNLAKVLYRSGQTDLAIEKANLVIQKSKNNRLKAEAELLLGAHYSSIGQYPEAYEHLNNSVALEPNFANVYVHLARTDLKSSTGSLIDFSKNGEEKLKSANVNIEKAISLNPNLVGAYIVKSEIVYMNQYNIHDQVAELEKALSIIPNDITLGVKEKEDIKKYIEDKLARLKLMLK